VGTVKKRFRIPISAKWLYHFIPQPHWIRRWYYRKSFEWWGHPSNHHWKMWGFGARQQSLLSGERDIWTGMYCSGGSERQR